MLGDLRSNNSNSGKSSNKLFENTYYSRLSFKNNDKLRLSFSYKSGMIVVSIDQEKEGFQFETLTSCYITTVKANVLLKEIDAYKADPNSNVCYGINTGMGDIATVLLVHSVEGKDAITIGKVDNTGRYTAKYTYRFDDITDGINLTDINDMNTTSKNSMSGLEFEMFINTIASFANNMNGAIAYSVADLTRYDHAGILKKMDPIYDKLGIERMSSGRGSGSSENNFFNGSKGGFRGRSNNTSLDEVMEDIPSEED